MEIGKVAEISGVPASTIRYYESLGILPKPRRNSGRRLYSAEILIHLKLVLLARDLGFRVSEMKTLFSGFRSDEKTPSDKWRQIATSKLAEIKRQKNQLATMERLLESALSCNCISLDACNFLLDSSQVSFEEKPRPKNTVLERNDIFAPLMRDKN